MLNLRTRLERLESMNPTESDRPARIITVFGDSTWPGETRDFLRSNGVEVAADDFIIQFVSLRAKPDAPLRNPLPLKMGQIVECRRAAA